MWILNLCLLFATISAFAIEPHQRWRSSALPESAKRLLAKEKCYRYLLNRLTPQDKRYQTFHLFLELIEKRGGKVIVETGTARNGCENCHGDGCSSVIFADFAKDYGLSFYSVDIDPQAIEASSRAALPLNPNAEFIVADSVAFLHNFETPIDFLYLDSYDFDEHNPLLSQLHHLYEIQAAYPHLHSGSVVMIDDCGLPHGGKGKLAIEWLLSKGWKVIVSKYQTILSYGPN